MQVVPIPSEAWGKFFSGDAYIILSSAPSGNRQQVVQTSALILQIFYSGGMSVKPGLYNGRLEQHIHFWLGEEASTDEVPLTYSHMKMNI